MPRTYLIEKTRDIGIIAHIDASSCFTQDSLKPIGFSTRPNATIRCGRVSATGKLSFSRPLSRINMRIFQNQL